MAKVKGVAIMSRVAVLKDKFGEAGLAAVLDRMKSQHRELLGSVIASSWYDEEIYEDFNKSIQKALSAKDPMIMEHLGEQSAEAGLKGIYSSRLKDGDVKMTLSRAAQLWKTFHDTGELTVEMSPDENKAIFKVIGYELPHVESCKNLIGWGRRMVELSGGTNVKVDKNKCVCKGDDYCEMAVRWD
jgi:hypothetical protein